MMKIDDCRPIEILDFQSFDIELFRNKYFGKAPVIFKNAFRINEQVLKEVYNMINGENYLQDSRFVNLVSLKIKDLLDKKVDKFYFKKEVRNWNGKFFKILDCESFMKVFDLLVTPIGIWLGSGENVTPLHFDSDNVFKLQLVGKKKWIIFHPSDSRCLYSYEYPKGDTLCPLVSSGNGPFHASRLRNIRKLYQKEITCCVPKKLFNIQDKPWEFTLNQCEILYNPGGFWHEVTSPVETLSLTLISQNFQKNQEFVAINLIS